MTSCKQAIAELEEIQLALLPLALWSGNPRAKPTIEDCERAFVVREKVLTKLRAIAAEDEK